MSTIVDVQHLTKRFGSVVAVQDASFQVQRGEIVGFLGPNGAGKTTTMRVLAGYLPATGGNVKIAGRDVFRESVEVRRRIGYMPESVPLYTDMRVGEYLSFRAALKGVERKHRRKRIGEVMDVCGLQGQQRRIIGNLSKGYRQRVGLADALVHAPELLILDEPTIGLDPIQIRQVREMIRDLSSHHTILLSSHILPEVEMTCQRVLIIHNGRIVASDTPDRLRSRLKGGNRILVEVQGEYEKICSAFQMLPHVLSVSGTAGKVWSGFEIATDGPRDLREEVFQVVVQRGWKLRRLDLDKQSLEDVFCQLTQEVDEVAM